MPIREQIHKQDSVLDVMRNRILSKTWKPGERIAPHTNLATQMGVSSFTVQRALEVLTQDGFTTSATRKGTYVSLFPPHLCRYALVFHHALQDRGWTRFWTALRDEAALLSCPPECDIRVFFGIDGHLDTYDYGVLEKDVRAKRLAGIIFTSNPIGLEKTPLLLDKTLPRVAISSGASSLWETVNLDLNRFIDRALDDLFAQGRRNVAIITPCLPDSPYGQHIFRAVAERGMTLRPYRFQTVDASTPEAARNCAHLLLHDPENRPDALIITDDNLVEYASAGVILSGAKAPQDVAVIAHCNFPWPAPSVIPVHRLGYDARQVLNLCVDRINAQRRGETLAPCAPVLPLFEEELNP